VNPPGPAVVHVVVDWAGGLEFDCAGARLLKRESELLLMLAPKLLMRRRCFGQDTRSCAHPYRRPTPNWPPQYCAEVLEGGGICMEAVCANSRMNCARYGSIRTHLVEGQQPGGVVAALPLHASWCDKCTEPMHID
jgi:hypothetical protein